MRDHVERDERSQKSCEERKKKQWIAPRVEELPPLTELALGSLAGTGDWGGWSFP